MTRVIYVVLNHNSTVLGQFPTKIEAESEATFYRYQTGNAAYVDEVTLRISEEEHNHA